MNSNRGGWLAAACLLAGLLVRLPFIAVDYRTTADMGLLRGWARTLAARGLAPAYRDTNINYPPVSIYWLAGAGWAEARFGSGLDLEAQDRLLNALIKLPPVVADVLTAGLIMLAAGPLSPGRRALAGGLYLFNPAVWYVSAHWGQYESVFTLWMVAALLALRRGRHDLAWAACALALCTKLLAVSLVPLLAWETWRARGWRGLAVGGLVCGCVAAALCAPWLAAGEGISLVRAVLPHAAPRVSVSGYNLLFLLFLGQVHAASSLLRPGGLPFSYRAIGIALYALFTLAVLALQWRRRMGRALPALPAALLALGLFTLLTEMHERYLFPALALLLAALFADDVPARRRWLAGAYAALSLTFAFNLVTIAPFNPLLGTNLVAATAAAPGLTVLQVLALLCAALNVTILAALTLLMLPRPAPRLAL